MADTPTTTQLSEISNLDTTSAASKLGRLLILLAFIGVIAGIVYVTRKVEPIAGFLDDYGHYWGEALLLITFLFYVIPHRRFPQPRTKAVSSDGPNIISVFDLVQEEETALYTDCAIMSRNIYVDDAKSEKVLGHKDFINSDVQDDKKSERNWKSEQLLECDWELVERIGDVTGDKLMIEVFRHQNKYVPNQGTGLTYAIVFRGSVGMNSWVANAHWLVKWLPYQDQYDQIKNIVPDIVTRIKQRHEGEDFNIIATGHSLGGGLAQHACYISKDINVAYVFNSSPVTGYTDFSNDERQHRDVRIYRLFERGEVLENFRFFMKIVYLFDPKPNQHPYIIEHRFDFKDVGLVSEHGMLPITVSLCFMQDRLQEVLADEPTGALTKELREKLDREIAIEILGEEEGRKEIRSLFGNAEPETHASNGKVG